MKTKPNFVGGSVESTSSLTSLEPSKIDPYMASGGAGDYYYYYEDNCNYYYEYYEDVSSGPSIN
jgi:hypothetical protein